jgi:phage N-6-adenine-methyltransferase
MNRDAYRTPPELFAALNAEFDFKLDACAGHENALCEFYITEQENCLTTDWSESAGLMGESGWFSFMNPPYSDIKPFVARANQMAKKGIGCVMLVMADTSVGWYAEAIRSCQEVRFIVGGRISFLDPETGKPAAGNNKGSMFLIWHPFGRSPLFVSHVWRDDLLAKGRQYLKLKEE